MSYQNDNLFEWFEVLFGKKSCIVAGKEYPLGYFAAEALEICSRSGRGRMNYCGAGRDGIAAWLMTSSGSSMTWTTC